MATKALTTEQAQEALNAKARYPTVVAAAASLNLTGGAFQNRIRRAATLGLRPLFYDGPPIKASDDDETDARLRAIRSRFTTPSSEADDLRHYGSADRMANGPDIIVPTQRMGDSVRGKRHIVIPDVQTKDGVPQEHLEWVGNYIAQKQPDVIVCIGDFADMPSLSMHDKNTLVAESRRYVNDISASRRAMEMLLKPIDDFNRTAKVKYNPRKVLTMGNHEYRIQRTVNLNPNFEGKFLMSDLGFEEFGWEVVPFLVPIEIDGVEYCHYFTSGVMGRPVSSAAALLRARQKSATMGHVQSTDIAMHQKTQQTGMFCGTCYLHDEEYLGPQGNVTRRQIVVKNEVRDGVYDPMLVSLEYLKKRYS